MSPNPARISIGISRCLMGENVRYDGGHCLAPLLVEQLGDAFNLRPICPEVGIGMGVPRNPIQLVKTSQGIVARGIDNNSVDVTEKLEQFAIACLQEQPMIYGYVFKSGSPSCGIQDAKIYDTSGLLQGSHETGIFTKTIIKMMPGFPIVDENILQQSNSIDVFIESVNHYFKSLQDI